MARITLIHAVRAAMDPISDAFVRLWPSAELSHDLNESLSSDLVREKKLTPAMTGRFVALAREAADTGADAILFTCSAFGPCIDAAAAAVTIPVRKPNEAMFRAASIAGKRIGLVASFPPSLPPMRVEFEQLAPNVRLETACAPDAMPMLAAGDAEGHDRQLAAAAAGLPPCDAIMLAQFSNARARPAVMRATGVPVLTAPDSAVTALKARLCG